MLWSPCKQGIFDTPTLKPFIHADAGDTCQPVAGRKKACARLFAAAFPTLFVPLPTESAAMIDSKLFDELSKHLSAVIAASPAADIEKNIRALLSGVFTRLDLVTREEFDVQANILQRTRANLQALETRVAQMEQALGEEKTSPTRNPE